MSQDKLENIIKNYAVPGVAVIRLCKGGNIALEVAGYTRQTNQTVTSANRITPSTKFQLASVSKLLTAWLVVELAKQNILELDQQHILQMPKGEAPQGVTLRQLLCHQAGFSKNIGFPGYKDSASVDGGRVIGGQCINSFNAKMIGRFQYSGCNYWLVQIILEQLLEQNFNELLQQWICRPCGMVDTTTLTPEEGEPLVARGHDTNGIELIGSWRRYTGVEAAAGIWSSAADIARMLQGMLQEKTTLNNHSCMTNASDLVDSQRGNGYHLGVLVERGKRGVILSHKGINPGYQAVVKMNIESKTASAVLANKEGCDAVCNLLSNDVL